MENVLGKVSATGVLPVIKIEKLEDARPLALAFLVAGIGAMEVTFRNDVAADAVKAIKDAYPEMVVGAGTILSPNLARQAIGAGADFLVSPGYNPVTVSYCLEHGITIVPGCSTPTELETAVSAGLQTVKFFPAELGGGVVALKLLSGPFPNLQFIPTGGINYSNLRSYLSNGFVAACGGSFMAKATLIREGQWDKITENSRKALQISLGFELAHVGINHNDRSEALTNAAAMDRVFPLGVKVGSEKSSFLGTAVEFMHLPSYDSNGHIGFWTNSCERSRAYFEKQGLAIREDSIVRDEKGRMKYFYLADKIGGFELHVVRK
ncbi:MAG: bifunctional 4-hydroxy-2-oxoglutarate aldolase/2-dehydro-3-deoxy-phosphogluconate aldolase [Clostridia bacterium]|nr:bifunctional 4-hydroxy-2-oxoglutarate aldolase/2-dehydro-3-deoxy-phosphogluconate aldolase [Clostridia bacterium]